jgi:leucyl aminopeptidase
MRRTEGLGGKAGEFFITVSQSQSIARFITFTALQYNDRQHGRSPVVLVGKNVTLQ